MIKLNRVLLVVGILITSVFVFHYFELQSVEVDKIVDGLPFWLWNILPFVLLLAAGRMLIGVADKQASRAISIFISLCCVGYTGLNIWLYSKMGIVERSVQSGLVFLFAPVFQLPFAIYLLVCSVVKHDRQTL